MKNSIWYSKRFWIGVSFFCGLVLISFLFTRYGKSLYSNSIMLLKNSDGIVSHSAPFNPLLMPPLGSDRNGYNLFYQLIIGAKSTILFVFGVSLIQLLLGTLLGALLAYTPEKLQNFIRKVFKVYFYVPTIIWVFLFMLPLMLESEATGFAFSIVMKQFLIICFIMLPTVTLYITEEINLLMKKEYITSSIVLGAQKLHLFRKHVWISLKEILSILFLQQSVQLFTLLIHMGFFNILIGGRYVTFDPVSNRKFTFSLTNEWSGLIGLNKTELMTAPWIILAPLVFFTISIFVLNFMIQGIKRQQDIPNVHIKKQKKKQKSLSEEKQAIIHAEQFNFAKRDTPSSPSS